MVVTTGNDMFELCHGVANDLQVWRKSPSLPQWFL